MYGIRKGLGESGDKGNGFWRVNRVSVNYIPQIHSFPIRVSLEPHPDYQKDSIRANPLSACITIYFIQRGRIVPVTVSSIDGIPADKSSQIPYTKEYPAIRGVCYRLNGAKTRGEFGMLLAHEVSRYSIFDLQIIGGTLNREVDTLPSPYREQIRPYFTEQLFGMHHKLLRMYRNGDFRTMHAPLSDKTLFSSYWEMVPQGCFSWDDQREKGSFGYSSLHRLFYYLISGFAMFVLENPGHPIGTPFPGGFFVEKNKGEFRCPVRDKEKDVFYSICNFCPAKQSDMPG